MSNDSIDEIRRREEQREASEPESDDPAEPEASPFLGLGRRQLILLGAATALIIAVWFLRHREPTGNSPAETVQDTSRIADTKAGHMIEIEDRETGRSIRVPANPDEELDKDAAIVRDSGIFGSDG